ncbi:CBO0543 family protein [Bacillaceae bacterium W0354]
MRSKQTQLNVLKVGFIVNSLILLPLILRKRPIKDWIIVYLFNTVTNTVLDAIVSRANLVKYPVRLFPKLFRSHILFDFFLYPTFNIIYNQWTYKDKKLVTILKLFIMTIPVFIIEQMAEKRTNLIKWSNKWKWYHSFFSIIATSLFTRIIIGMIRLADKE